MQGRLKNFGDCKIFLEVVDLVISGTGNRKKRGVTAYVVKVFEHQHFTFIETYYLSALITNVGWCNFIFFFIKYNNYNKPGGVL